MQTIIVHWIDWLIDTKVERFASYDDAATRTGMLPNDRTILSFSDNDSYASQLSAYTIKRLVELRNALNHGTKITSFHDKESGMRSVADRIRFVANEQPLQEHVTMSEEHTEVAETEQPKRRTRKPREESHAVGEFKQVRPDTHLGRIAGHALDGSSTLDEIGEKVGLTADQVKGHLTRARVTHGIDHTVDDHGTVSLVVPDERNLFKEPAPVKEKVEGAPRSTMATKMLEAARSGTLPAPPDFSAETHKNWRKKLGELTDMVAKRDVAGLREYKINPISTSPRALERYRDAAVIALENQ